MRRLRLDGCIEVSWTNDNFKTIEVADAEGDRANYAWSYADGRVASVSYTVPSLSTIERSFVYDDTRNGREKQVTTVRSTEGQSATQSAYQYFRYDDDGLLEEVDNIEGDGTTSKGARRAGPSTARPLGTGVATGPMMRCCL